MGAIVRRNLIDRAVGLILLNRHALDNHNPSEITLRLFSRESGTGA